MNPKTCPTCNTPIPPHAPGGLCPACVLLGADEAESVLQHGPLPEEVADAFPKLEILRLIGHGGMGFVYQARQPDLDRMVALKILSPALRKDPAFEERFAREARVLGKLKHPNIVTLYEHGESGGYFYLMMEFVDGVNLRQAMSAGRFSPEQALAIVPAICDALQSAHAQGVWHRDIKPENILLDKDGRVKIADFGIARIVGDPERNFTLTRTGGQLGSAAYMAPEQHEKPHSVDHRADIYSLGVVIYEMLTGELPLGRFPLPSQRAEVGKRIDEIVLRTLEKERELRQQSAGEVKTEVEGLARNAPSIPRSSQSRSEVPHSSGAKWNFWGMIGSSIGSSVWMPMVAITSGWSGAGVALSNLTAAGVLLAGLTIWSNRHRLKPIQGLLLLLVAVFVASTTFLLGAQAMDLPVRSSWPGGRMVSAASLLWKTLLLFLALGVWVWFIHKIGNSRSGETPSENPETGSRESTMHSRFSRTAIVGACLLFLPFALGVIGPVLTGPIAYSDRPGMAFVGFFQTLALAMAIASTILGWIAVSQIRRSAGKLHGMWLAVFDGLFFPLLALDVGIFLLLGNAWRIYGQLADVSRPFDAFLLNHDFGKLCLFLLAPVICVFVDWLIIRRVWRAVNGTSNAPRNPSSLPQNTPRSILACCVAYASGLVAAATWILMLSGQSASPWYWGILIMALLGMVLAIGVQRTSCGKQALWFGGVQVIVWIFFLVIFNGYGFRGIPSLQRVNGAGGPTVVPSFGPVMERVLPFRPAGIAPTYSQVSYIDFQSGSVICKQWKLEELARDEGTWSKAHGVDAIADQVMRPDGLDGPDLEQSPRLVGNIGGSVFVQAKPGETFDSMQAADVAANLQRMKELNVSYDYAATADPNWFQTSDGAKGIVQILGRTEDGSGMRIRYKLVQNATSPTTADPSPAVVKELSGKISDWLNERGVTMDGLRFERAPGSDSRVLASYIGRKFTGEIGETQGQVLLNFTPPNQWTLYGMGEFGGKNAEWHLENSGWPDQWPGLSFDEFRRMVETSADTANASAQVNPQKPISPEAVAAYRELQEFLYSKQPREFADPDTSKKLHELIDRLGESMRGTQAEPLWLKAQKLSEDSRRAYARGDDAERRRLDEEEKQIEKELQGMMEQAGAPKHPDSNPVPKAPESKASATRLPGSEFSRAVADPADYQSQCLVSLDAGTVSALPEELKPKLEVGDPKETDGTFVAWMRERRADAVARFIVDDGKVVKFGLRTFGLIAIPLNEGTPDQITSEEAGKRLDQSLSEWGFIPEINDLMLDSGEAAAYLVQTRSGSRGILRITGFNKQPRGVNIHFMLTRIGKEDRPPQSTTVQPVAQKPSFGPVVEATVTSDFYDLDTGKSLKAPAEIQKSSLGSQPARDWIRASGVDLGCLQTQPSGLMLVDGPAMLTTSLSDPGDGRTVPRHIDQITTDDVLSTVAMFTPEWKKTSPQDMWSIEPSSASVFKTREGAIGVIEIIGYTEIPRGVKIRYKLVQTKQSAAAETLPTDSAKAVQPLESTTAGTEAGPHTQASTPSRLSWEKLFRLLLFLGMAAGGGWWVWQGSKVGEGMGRLSLATALLGLGGGWVLAGFVFFLLAEITALVTGILSRSTKLGKAGMFTAIVLMLLSLLTIA